MKALHKLFFETKMTWPRVILFALATAVLTAALLIVPIFRDTSFENIGVTYEAWFLFALIIIMNCDKPLEAGLKTFVFFLISQPLIYLLQVPFSSAGWELFDYYGFWFKLTLLTLPGGMIAWFVKKDNLLSALILAVATGFLGFHLVNFLNTCIGHFPKYLLSVIFIAAEIVVFILVLLNKNRNRIITAAITIVVTAIMLVHSPADNSGVQGAMEYYPIESGHVWEISSREGDLGDAEICEDIKDTVLIYAKEFGTETITLVNEQGETLVLEVTYNNEDEGLVITEK